MLQYGQTGAVPVLTQAMLCIGTAFPIFLFHGLFNLHMILLLLPKVLGLYKVLFNTFTKKFLLNGCSQLHKHFIVLPLDFDP
jgi:hypothetical protein